MKHLLAVAAIAGLASLGSVAAHAAPGVSPMPSAVTASSDIDLVAQGCGPGGFRDRFGRCVGRPVYRRCPPGLHPTPRGCRPNY